MLPPESSMRSSEDDDPRAVTGGFDESVGLKSEVDGEPRQVRQRDLQRHPIWLHTVDALRHRVATGDLVRLNTSIGYLVGRVWVTRASAPVSAHAPTTWDVGACTTPRAAAGSMPGRHHCPARAGANRRRAAGGRTRTGSRPRVGSTRQPSRSEDLRHPRCRSSRWRHGGHLTTPSRRPWRPRSQPRLRDHIRRAGHLRVHPRGSYRARGTTSPSPGTPRHRRPGRELECGDRRARGARGPRTSITGRS